MHERAKLLVRYAFAIAAIGVLAQIVDLAAVGHALAQASPAWVLGGLAVGYAAVALNTWKWRLLIASQMPAPRYSSLLRLNLVAALYGALLPGQVAGEAVKVARLARERRHRAVLVASVLADRITGLIGLLAIGVVGGAVSSAPVVVQTTLIVSLVGTMCGAVALTFVTSGQATAHDGPVGLGVRVRSALRSVAAATSGFRTARRAALVTLLLAAVFQVCVTLVIACFARALSIDVAFADLAWLTAVISIVQLLPVTIASIGTREGAFIVLMASLGVGRTDALSLSLLVLVSNLTLAVGGGLVELTSSRSSFDVVDPLQEPGVRS